MCCAQYLSFLFLVTAAALFAGMCLPNETVGIGPCQTG